jgi:hypothetical protein
VRIAWAWKEGHLPDDVLDPWDLVIAGCMLEQFHIPLAPLKASPGETGSVPDAPPPNS